MQPRPTGSALATSGSRRVQAGSAVKPKEWSTQHSIHRYTSLTAVRTTTGCADACQHTHLIRASIMQQGGTKTVPLQRHLVDADGLAHSALEVEALHILPVLLQE